MQVSVIIPSYNHRRYVTQAIESVLNQDWPNVDLLVIDDGSEDGSAEVIRELLERRGGFRFIARENRGLIATLNEGLEKALGEVICLLASDDYLPPGSLSRRARVLAASPDCVAVFGDGLQVSAGGDVQERMMDGKRRRLFELSDPVSDFLKGTNLFIHTMMARTEVLKRIGGFDPRYRHCEDLDIQLLLFLQGRVDYVDSPIYCYRRHETNVSLRNSHIARADKVLCYRKYLEEIPQLAIHRNLIRYRLRRQYLLLGRYISSSRGSDRDREVFRGGWEFAWQDPRLLWHLVRHKIREKLS